jgi:hypothetical protein
MTKSRGIKNVDENNPKDIGPNVFIGRPVPVSSEFPIEAFGLIGLEILRKLLRREVRTV